MRAYKDHFGMIVASVIALCLSFIMAASAIFVDHLDFSLVLLARNWGTAFLVITVTGFIFPLTSWSFRLCDALKIKPMTFGHALVENFVATLFFNTTATLVLAAVNIFGNAGIESAIAAGAIPFASTITQFYIHTVLSDWPIMFVISYVLALFVTRLAVKIARYSCDPSELPHL